jgi:hypothetical protein
MSHGLIIAVIICLAIFFGSLEQARIVLRRQQNRPTTAPEARRNTLRGELVALGVGITQVQGYIDALKTDQSEAVVKVVLEAQTGLDRAKTIKQEIQDSLDKADSETALQICALKLDQARFYVHHARTAIENQTAANGEDQDGDK